MRIALVVWLTLWLCCAGSIRGRSLGGFDDSGSPLSRLDASWLRSNSMGFDAAENDANSSGEDGDLDVDCGLYVDAVNGNDGNNGTSPTDAFQTIGRAQEVVRSLIASNDIPVGGLTVCLNSGYYPAGLTGFQFGTADSGLSESQSIRWVGLTSSVALVAGEQLASDGWSKSSLGSGIYEYNIAAANLSAYVGQLSSGAGLGSCSGFGMMELFYGGQPMILARYPNIIPSNNTWLWSSAGAVINETSFKYIDSRPPRWVNETDLWLHGYWKYDWADNYCKVQGINVTDSSIVLSSSTEPIYGLTEGARYMAVNALSELDAEGEYYIDRVNFILYFYPPGGYINESESCFVSVGKNVLVLAEGTKYLSFSSLSFQYSQQTLVIADGVSNVRFDNVLIANGGTSGISLIGFNSSISNSEIYGTGCGAASVGGGNINALTPGEMVVLKNSIHDYARILRTYTPAIGFSGVGNYYGGNVIQNGPHAGILGGGNNLLIEYNILENLCYETTDAGAFYTGRSWSQWGNTLRFNYFKNIRHTENEGGVSTTDQVQAIYLDDEMSGWQVYNNTVENAQVGVLLGGGRMNNITDNYFVNCDLPVFMDDRGESWQKSYCEVGGVFNQELIALNYTNPPYATEYPWLPNIFNEQPCVPVYNHIINNQYCNASKGEFIDVTTEDLAAWSCLFYNNVESC